MRVSYIHIFHASKPREEFIKAISKAGFDSREALARYTKLKDPHHHTALFYAVDHNREANVQFLLKIGLDSLEEDLCGVSALGHAGRLGLTSMVEKMLSHLGEKARLPESQLVLVFEYSPYHEETFEMLLSHGNWDLSQRSIVAAATYGCLTNEKRERACARLLEYGVDFKGTDAEAQKWGERLKVFHEQPRPMSEFFNLMKADESHRRGRQRSRTPPIFTALEHHKIDHMMSLLSQEPQSNPHNAEGETLFGRTCKIDIWKRLLRAGAYPDFINVFPNSSNEPLLNASLGKDVELLTMLLEPEGGWPMPNLQRTDALQYAASLKDSEILKLFLDKGYNPNQRDVNNELPLSHARTISNMDLLVEKGAFVDGPDGDGEPLFQICVDRGSKGLDLISNLAKHGADFNVKWDGKTVFIQVSDYLLQDWHSGPDDEGGPRSACVSGSDAYRAL